MSHWIWPWNWFRSAPELTSREKLEAVSEQIENLLEVLTSTVQGLAELPAELETVTADSDSRIEELKAQIAEEEAVKGLVKTSTSRVTLVAGNINQLLGNAETEEDGNTEEVSGEETSTD